MLTFKMYVDDIHQKVYLSVFDIFNIHEILTDQKINILVSEIIFSWHILHEVRRNIYHIFNTEDG